jgi:phage tail sheath protein FI
MPEYLAPAVYVEETSFRSKSIEGVGTSTAAFVGLTARGPVSAGIGGVAPPLLTSFTDYELYYGGVDSLVINGTLVPNYLAQSAAAFFANGGARLYVARVLGAGAATAASGAINAGGAPAAAADAIALVARFAGGASLPGAPGVNFSVRLVLETLASSKGLALRQTAGTMVLAGADHFIMGGPGNAPLATTAANLNAWTALPDTTPVSIQAMAVQVTAPSGLVAEYAGLGFHARHPRPALLVLGAAPPATADALTNPIVLQAGGNVDHFALLTGLFSAAADRTVTLSGGSDGTGAPSTGDYTAALDRLLALEDISIVAAPGASAMAAPTPAAVNQLLIGHAETRRSYRIAVLDTPPSEEPSDVRTLKSLLDSKYAALYYPWVRVANPLAATDKAQPALIDLPPSGFVCGIYARTDIQRGVFKAPANEVVTGALGLQRDVHFGEQEVLNPLGINCIRTLPNRGIRVWGARTLSSDPEWKYVNIRRYFLYLEASIDRGTQWAVFEPNGERLWANITTTVTDFLYNEWIGGALLGTTPKEAFFVRCDRSTMTQNDLDNGRLICLVGVAAIKPAEFVIFRIGQKTADSRD